MPAHAEPGADQPDMPPVYSGPTPADPFGGHTFDIFDVLEQADEVERSLQEATAVVAEPSPAVHEPELTPSGPETPAVRIDDEPELMQEQVREPASEPEPPPEPEPEPDPVAMAAEIVSEPAVKPIIIGGDQDAIVEKRRGWWRR